MANKTLPTLTAASAVAGTDLLLVREGADSEDNKATFSQVKTYIEGNLASTTLAGTLTQTSNSASAIISGPNGATNPVLTVSNNTGSQATGVQILGKTAGNSADIIATSSSGSENLRLLGKGSTGGVQLGGNSSTVMTVLPYRISTTVGTNTNAGAGFERFLFTGAANTTLTAGTEFNQVWLNLGQTNQHASNTAITTQRDVRFTGMTHSFASATGTITDHYVVSIDAPAAAGTNAAITNNYSLHVAGNTSHIGKTVYDSTITAGGTTGNQTIDKPSGTVNIAAAGTTVTVTNSFCTTSSIVYAVLRTNDSTATIKNVVPGAGSFVITLTAAATAEVSVGFVVFN